MSLPLGLSPRDWGLQKNIVAASQCLREELARRYPGIREIVARSPQAALESVPDVEVRWTVGPPKGACELGGVYDGDREPPLITVRRFENDKRNNFTCLHELGHHLLAQNEEWQYDVLPTLGRDARRVEEKIVNDFAASLLISDTDVELHLGSGVSARGIISLIQQTHASATSCCIRALHRPGERLIMLADLGGHIWWSGSSGSPYNPGRKVRQPALLRAIERAQEDAGEHTIVGGEGIRYSTGNSNTDISLNVALYDALAVAVVTSTRPQSRGWVDGSWEEICEQCGSGFLIDNSPGHCAKCDAWKCPHCRTCDCVVNNAVYCMKCFLQLSVAEAATGQTQHEECP